MFLVGFQGDFSGNLGTFGDARQAAYQFVVAGGFGKDRLYHFRQ